MGFLSFDLLHRLARLHAHRCVHQCAGSGTATHREKHEANCDDDDDSTQEHEKAIQGPNPCHCKHNKRRRHTVRRDGRNDHAQPGHAREPQPCDEGRWHLWLPRWRHAVRGRRVIVGNDELLRRRADFGDAPQQGSNDRRDSRSDGKAAHSGNNGSAVVRCHVAADAETRGETLRKLEAARWAVGRRDTGRSADREGGENADSAGDLQG